MSSIHGKNSLSFRRVKTDELSSSATISNDYKFAHKASAGETQIDLLSLVNPPEMPSFVNPTGTQLTAINLKANKNSFILISSLRGTLISELSYQINTSKIITLNFVAAEGEIFTGQLRTTQATANVVDAQTYTRTGTLLTGQTDIALGQAFNQNAFPTSQIGEVMLHIGGVLQLRNVDNATAAPLADGNYEEVSAGNGLTNVLRLNNAFGADVAWAVTSTGLIVDQSGNNNQQQLDSLAGQIDALIPTVASLAGVPETNFQAGPNSVDLKAFADKLYQACRAIDTLTVELAVVNNKEVEVAQQETITYTEYISTSGSNFTKLKTEETNTNVGIISADNSGDHTRYTFLKDTQFVATTSGGGSGSNGYVGVSLYDSSNVLKQASTGAVGPSGLASSALSGNAVIGDYLVQTEVGLAGMTDNLGTNLTVTATKLVTTKIKDL